MKPLFLFVSLFVGIFVFSQQRADLFGSSWYQFGMYDAYKVAFTEDTFVRKPVTGNDPRDVRTMNIVAWLPNDLAVFEKQGKYMLVRIQVQEAQLVIYSLYNGTSLDAVKNAAERYEEIQGIDLFDSQVAYNEAAYKKILSSEGLDKITAKDLKNAILEQQKLKALTQEYYTKFPDKASNQYAIYRVFNDLMKRRFVAQGYNPWKEVVYNFEDMFADDLELIKLLTSMN